MKKMIFTLMIAGLFLAGCARQQSEQVVEQWDVFEVELHGPATGNPYMDIELYATFGQDETRVKVPGFYDGEGVYRIRFSPSTQGEWNYRTESNEKELSGIKGKFDCIPPSGKNHGPVKVTNTFYLEYADGTPFYSTGTTAYQWTSVKQEIQEKTLQTLVSSPFNKIRMCVFPKHYQYGNETEPWNYPFEREGAQNDYNKPNYAFFQNFDIRVRQLMEMGIEADIILFHPYDSWGYSKMGKEWNEKYVRYMIARLSAYRNVWWSLANEWDVPSIRETIDWEGIGTLLQKEDPHQRMRGIHNWYNSEEHFYDHNRPWVTHVSAQTSQFYNAIKWRNQYQKPLLLDEMRYEGDVPSGWGNLSAQEMSSYFWMAGLSGGYPTHGDTYRNDSDDSTEVRWWAKGGTLAGDSPQRIQFFRNVMEQIPIKEMIPELIVHSEPENLNNNIYILSKTGVYYLVFTSATEQTVEINLPGQQKYKAEIIDTWNMKTVDEKWVEPGRFIFKTNFPFTAIRLTVAHEQI